MDLCTCYAAIFLSSRSRKVIRSHVDRSGTYDFLLTCHSNRGPILCRFQDIARYWAKIAISLNPSLFQAPFTLRILQLQRWGYHVEKMFDIFSGFHTMHECVGQTDGYTPDNDYSNALRWWCRSDERRRQLLQNRVNNDYSRYDRVTVIPPAR